MNRFLSLALLAGLAAAVPAQAARLSPDEELARAIKDRVEGPPVDCIQLRDIRSSRIIDRTAIVYETNGGRVYVNRPDSGASSLSWNDVLVTDTHSSQLCSIDIVRLYDTGSRMQTGFVGLGKFVPYTKARRG